MSDMPVNADEVRHVAELARVGLDEGEVEEPVARFADILGYFDALGEVPEVDREGELVNVVRSDKVCDGLAQEEALPNATETENGFSKDPRVSQMSLNAFVMKETLDGSDNGPLVDKSIAIRDDISAEGLRTTCGSTMFEDYVPSYDATVVKLPKDAGATIVGRASIDEFSMGTTTEISAFGPTKNPIDESRIPGGSSGGSVVAVAAGRADFAPGTDTGGSIRCPAMLCGAVGIKPTYGLVSRYDLVVYANSLGRIGPTASTVEGAAALLDVIASPDDRDDMICDASIDSNYVAATNGDVKGLTTGAPTKLAGNADEGIEEVFWAALDELEAQGAEYREVSMPSVEKTAAAYYTIATPKASSDLARFDGVRYGKSDGYDGDRSRALARAREDGFDSEVKHRILLGMRAPSTGYHDKYYVKAQGARAWIEQDFDEMFKDVDAVASPTMPVPPSELSKSLDDPFQMYLVDANTVPVNLASPLAISAPAGKTDGLPVDLQLIGPKFDEETIVHAAPAAEN